MAALAQPDPLPALERLQHAYVHEQRYQAKPTPLEVSRACRRFAAAVLGESDLRTRTGVALTIITARARGPLAHAESKIAFGRAVLSNTLSRRRLAAYLERVVFHAGSGSFLTEAFDTFGLVRVPLDTRNQEDALLASGTIPLLCSPVRDIAGAPHGNYWDGALVDYHLLLPYPQLIGARTADGRGPIVLYPHFNTWVTPGWLDKHLPWRKAPRRHPWLENVLLVAPSRIADRAPAEPQAPGPAGLLPLRRGSRRARTRLERRDRRVRALRGRGAALDGAPGPDADPAALTPHWQWLLASADRSGCCSPAPGHSGSLLAGARPGCLAGPQPRSSGRCRAEDGAPHVLSAHTVSAAVSRNRRGVMTQEWSATSTCGRSDVVAAHETPGPNAGSPMPRWPPAHRCRSGSRADVWTRCIPAATRHRCAQVDVADHS